MNENMKPISEDNYDIYSAYTKNKIRSYIKARVKGLSVKQKGVYMVIENPDGDFTEEQKDKVIEMGLVHYREFGNHIGLNTNEQRYLVEKWGLFKEVSA